MLKSQPVFIPWRFYVVLTVIAVAVMGLSWRVFDLAILNQHFLRKQGDERALRLVSTPAFRGMIVDRNGFPLAVSTTVFSIWANPQEFNPTKQQVVELAKLLDLRAKDINALINKEAKKKREFVYLKRSITPEITSHIKALDIPGVYAQEEYRRYYPEGEVAAQVIGFTNVDDQGQEGIELGYNQWLQGEPGKKWVIKDRLGRVISDVQTLQDERAGNDVMLSIDRRVQYIAYRELINGVQENNAASGSVIILDAKTGEILAMANAPSFNPNNRAHAKSETFRNRAITDTFEPGSTIKAFSVATALDSGHFKPDTVIDTYPGWMRVGRNVVRDEHNNGKLSVTEILMRSSNVGATKMILSLPPNQLWSLLNRVGFGEITGVGFPGEAGGSLTKHDPWGAFTLATLSFGYGLSVTPLQLARAYDVIANDGVKLPVSLVRLNSPPKGERVMDASIAKEMRYVLESVLQKGGTGEHASVPGYRIAGKTGTAKMVSENGGYYKHKYVSSFVGMMPIESPRFVIAVIIRDPQGKHFLGGEVAGPVFQHIAEEMLRLFDVPPDQIQQEKG